MTLTPLETLRQLRKDYPTPMSREQNGELLNRFCLARPGYAMYSKPDGNSAIAPDGETISRDTIIDLVTLDGYDCLIDSEGKATPCWELNHEHVTDPRRIKHPVGSVPIPTPTPVPVPTPQPQPPAEFDWARFEAALSASETRIRAALAVQLDQVLLAVNSDRTLTGKVNWNGNLTGTVKKG